ncbi:hypothetical protein BDQ12DRAFT_673221 [Crucibulum laeve]|uniref:Uncharacterized protein n=1 Tax=Crucibulum laeve TaxID=68775 RepID=A0A5C3MJI7_9AGAR|nr:hypothetical protein BDQ12DRAFT_673221 [Crucibulum laeve]
MTSKDKDLKPFSLPNSLQDLALLRASDVGLASLLPQTSGPRQESSSLPIDSSLNESYDFVRSARAALKIYDRGDVDVQGAKVDDVRNKLEDLQAGLGNSDV